MRRRVTLDLLSTRILVRVYKSLDSGTKGMSYELNTIEQIE